MVSCSASVIKLLLIVFNLVFLVLGAGVTFIGVKLALLNHDFEDISQISDINFNIVSFCVLGVGILILLVSVSGFFGACCQSACLLNLYAAAIVALIAGEAVLIYFSQTKQLNIEDEVDHKMKDIMKDLQKIPNAAFLVQELQFKSKCCGWDGPGDYGNNDTIPASCCGERVSRDDPAKTCPISKDHYTIGCKSLIPFNEINTYLGSPLVVGIIAILIEVIVVLAACCLAKEFR